MLTVLTLLLWAALIFFVIKFKYTYTPAGVLVFLFAILISVLLIFFQSWVVLHYVGLFFILLCVAVFVGGYFATDKIVKTPKQRPLLWFNRKLGLIFLVILIALGMAYPIYNIYKAGFTIVDLFSLESLSEMTNRFSINRYFEDEIIGYSYATQLLLIFTYSAPVLGGFLWVVSKKNWYKVFCALSLLPCIICTLSQSTKMSTIAAIILFASGFLTAVITFNVKIRYKIWHFVVVGVLVFSFLAFMFYSLLTRYSSEYDDTKFERNKLSLFDYTFGSLLCFDFWFNDYLDKRDYSTIILQNSRLHRLGFFTNVDDGVRVAFDTLRTAPFFEVYGRMLDQVEYLAGNNYTIQFDVKSNVKPDSAKISLLSYSTMPKGHFFIEPNEEKQIGLYKWHYTFTFNLDSTRSYVRTPDIILSFDSLKYVEITHLHIDTGTVARNWVDGSGNMFWHNNNLKYGAMTFSGVSNLLGFYKRQIGIYRDFVNFGRLDKSLHSNVYTIFRMLIDDFGVIGALGFLLLLGFAAAIAVAFIAKRRFVAFCQTLLVAIYCYISWSFVASFWAYTSYLITFALCFAMFAVLQRPLHRKINKVH